jgi:integrase
MSFGATGSARRPAEAAPAPADWRVERIASLTDGAVLADEWDADRFLLIPDPEGRLSRDRPCAVAGCRNVRRGIDPLCHSHRRRFERSGGDDLSAWLASDGPGSRRRWVSEETCIITGPGGEACPRPAAGAWGLCHGHDTTWRDQRRTETSFEQFLDSARPLPSFGPCVVASCYLAAAHRRVRLCELHSRLWHDAGCPRGANFEAWAARARQPVNHRVLSLRGLPELVRLELVYAISCRVKEQIRTATGNMRRFVDELLSSGIGSMTEFDLAGFDPTGNQDWGRFARFSIDRVRLAYGDVEREREGDVWDLRHFGGSGRLDFTGVRQEWLREATKAWAATALANRNHPMVRRRVGSIAVLSRILAGGRGGGADPAGLSRRDVDRFLLRVRSMASPATGQPYSTRTVATVVEDCAFVLREARDMGLLAGLAPTFAIRRGDNDRVVHDEEPGRALPAHVVAQLDANLELLSSVPGSAGGPAHRNLGVLGARAGQSAVLAYQLLKGTGRRVGEVASLHLECLELDEDGKPVLVYDNHKAARMRRRLPLADSGLVAAIRAQQAWVRSTFPDTPAVQLWLLPRPTRNRAGTAHLPATQIAMWMRTWVTRIARIDAGTLDATGEPLAFDRAQIHPHAFRHTYAQTLADQGVAAPVLRDLMDHQSIDTTMGYYRVGEAKKRAAMELLARHTIDNRGTVRPVEAKPSKVAELREQLSWVAVPMGKCAEPTNVRAGGQACPIRYQCAGCPHFESDPSYLPELSAYADELRREREAMIAVGAADWVVANVTGQLGVITDHIAHHEAALRRLPAAERAVIEDASATLRKARQALPVAFGRRREETRP